MTDGGSSPFLLVFRRLLERVRFPYLGQSSASAAPSDLTESPVSLTQRNQVQPAPRLSSQQLLQLIRNSNGVNGESLSSDAGKENSRPLPGAGHFSGSVYLVDPNSDPNDSDAEEITSDIHPILPDQQAVLLQEQQLYNDQHQQGLPSFGKVRGNEKIGHQTSK